MKQLIRYKEFKDSPILEVDIIDYSPSKKYVKYINRLTDKKDAVWQETSKIEFLEELK